MDVKYAGFPEEGTQIFLGSEQPPGRMHDDAHVNMWHKDVGHHPRVAKQRRVANAFGYWCVRVQLLASSERVQDAINVREQDFHKSCLSSSVGTPGGFGR